ncbi:MAG: hypothetical protein Q8P60_11635 [Pseudorhodobacter sp.]|nr:hypothetical protein [Pseudorhodobacter sp.]
MNTPPEDKPGKAAGHGKAALAGPELAAKAVAGKRDERLKAALKANMARRKAQARARRGMSGAVDDETR